MSLVISNLGIETTLEETCTAANSCGHRVISEKFIAHAMVGNLGANRHIGL